jgi:hypothetical protein
MPLSIKGSCFITQMGPSILQGIVSSSSSNFDYSLQRLSAGSISTYIPKPPRCCYTCIKHAMPVHVLLLASTTTSVPHKYQQ